MSQMSQEGKEGRAPLMMTSELLFQIREYIAQLKLTDAQVQSALASRGVASLEGLTNQQAVEIAERLRVKAASAVTDCSPEEEEQKD